MTKPLIKSSMYLPFTSKLKACKFGNCCIKLKPVQRFVHPLKNNNSVAGGDVTHKKRAYYLQHFLRYLSLEKLLSLKNLQEANPKSVSKTWLTEEMGVSYTSGSQSEQTTERIYRFFWHVTDPRNNTRNIVLSGCFVHFKLQF